MEITLKKEREMIELLKEGYSLKDIPIQTEKICESAISYYVGNLLYVKPEFLSEKLKIAAIRKDSSILPKIKKPTLEMMFEAIKKDPSLIKEIGNLSNVFLIAVIKHNPLVLEYIENPSDKVKIEALKLNGLCLKFIKNPTNAMKKIAITQNPSAIKYIKKQSKSLQELAIDNDIYSYRFFNKNYSTKDLRIFALKKINSQCENVLIEFIFGKMLFTIEDNIAISVEEFKKYINKDGGIAKNDYKLEYLKILEFFKIR